MDSSPIQRRKSEHISVVLEQDVGFHQTTTLLEQVWLVHEALPDLSLGEIDTSTTILGKQLHLPVFIAAMTGGSDQSREVNLQLAAIAQQRGCGFGLGSQRPMLNDPDLTDSYQVRSVAPDVLVLGNIGLVQARGLSTACLRQALADVGADALCVHMNPAMEVVQPEGDGDFRLGLATFERLAAELGRPVIAKETGCGIALSTLQRLFRAGIRHVDVSGAGGTSWVAVEAHRAQGSDQGLGSVLREWGIPTAASVVMAKRASMCTIVATGGIRTGLDLAKSIALGASATGIARPVLQALHEGGCDGVHAYLDRIERQLRAVMLLVGAANIEQLRHRPYRLGPDLKAWTELEPGD